MKSVPDDDLLKMLAADLDPAHVKQLDQILWTQELQECMTEYNICISLLLMPFESTRASKLSGPMLLHSGKGTITRM